MNHNFDFDLIVSIHLCQNALMNESPPYSFSEREYLTLKEVCINNPMLLIIWKQWEKLSSVDVIKCFAKHVFSLRLQCASQM